MPFRRAVEAGKTDLPMYSRNELASTHFVNEAVARKHRSTGRNQSAMAILTLCH